MEAGHWFLSIYNDDGEARQVSFITKVSPELTRNCPKGCHGKGECVLGRCQCKPGFDGPDCGQSMYKLDSFTVFYCKKALYYPATLFLSIKYSLSIVNMKSAFTI